VHVALVARDAARLDAAVASIENAVAFVGDVSDGSSAEELVARIHDRFGRIDILVNNAGRAMSSRVEALDNVAVRALFDLNVFGPVALMQAVIPGMRERGRGAILNVSSGTSLERYPRPGRLRSVQVGPERAHIRCPRRARGGRDHGRTCLSRPDRDLVRGERESRPGTDRAADRIGCYFRLRAPRCRGALCRRGDGDGCAPLGQG